MEIPDDMLMVRGAQGDQEAFRLLVERWETPIFAFLLRMLGSREEAQDLCQETFLSMIRSADTYQSMGQFRSWLFRIAGNLARSRLRRKKILRWLSFEQHRPDPPADGPDPGQILERSELHAEVREALGRLPHRQREALILRQYQGLKYAEIAEVMGVSTSAVQMLLHRAMSALREDFVHRGGAR